MKLLMASGDTMLARGQRGAFYNTLEGLAAHWERIDVLTPPASGAAPVILFGNVHIHLSPSIRLAQPVFIRQHGSRLIEKHGHNLIASHDYGLFLNGRGAAALSRSTGVPYISEIHHVDGHPRAGSARERLQPWLTRQYVKWAQQRALGFRITNATELRPLLKSWGVPDARLHLLYSLYLDLDVFHPQATATEYDAIFVGRLARNKNPQLFLKAFAQLRGSGRRALVVGDGPLRGELQRLARRLRIADRVTFQPWVKDQTQLADLYRRARCLVCTSFSEGGPRVVAEALACGVPVISTRVGLASELIQHGVNGFLVDWDVADVSAHIAQLLADANGAARMGAAASSAVQRFEKSRVIADYAHAYQQLAQSSTIAAV